MDWWPEGRFGCPKGTPPVRPQPEGGGLPRRGLPPRRGGGQAGRKAGRPAGRQAGWLSGRLAAAAGGQQGMLSARRLRAAPARDGRASRAAAKVPRARVPRLAHLCAVLSMYSPSLAVLFTFVIHTLLLVPRIQSARPSARVGEHTREGTEDGGRGPGIATRRFLPL